MRKFKPGSIISVLFLLILNLFTYRGFYFSDVNFPYDFPMGHYSFVAYWIASLQEGIWPQWIPFQSMGYPFALNLHSGIFYPPMWFFVLTGLPYSLQAAAGYQCFHVFLGSLGCFLLARKLFASPATALIGGICFHLYGGFYSNAEHPDIIRAFALIPWIFWALYLNLGAVRTISIGNRSFETRLSWHNLLAPFVFYCTITGAYIGNVIALGFVIPFFLVAQGLRDSRGGKWAVGLRDFGLLILLLGIGGLMTSAFLVPGFLLSNEMLRHVTYASESRWYLIPRDLICLFFPESLVYGTKGDISMIGWQFPIVLAVFGIFARRRNFFLLSPFLAVAAAALIMSFKPLYPVSEFIRTKVSFLALSRFPSGDYRTLFAFPVLLVFLAGLDEFMMRVKDGERIRRRAIISLVILMAVTLSLTPLINPLASKEFLRNTLLIQSGCVLLAFPVGYFLIKRNRILGAGLAIGILCAISFYPIQHDFGRFWYAPHLEKDLYRALPLWKGDQLTVYDIFKRPPLPRPARLVKKQHDYSWRGYITGDYMMSDYGGFGLNARKAVEDQPALYNFMRMPSALTIIDPTAASIKPSSKTEARVERFQPNDKLPGQTSKTIAFEPNHIRYEVALSRAQLVVENEIFSAGWTGSIKTDYSTTTLVPVKVNGALRGWFLPGGHYKFDVSYSTPHMKLGIGLSLIAVAAYAIVAWFIARSFARREAPPMIY